MPADYATSQNHWATNFTQSASQQNGEGRVKTASKISPHAIGKIPSNQGNCRNANDLTKNHGTKIPWNRPNGLASSSSNSAPGLGGELMPAFFGIDQLRQPFPFGLGIPGNQSGHQRLLPQRQPHILSSNPYPIQSYIITKRSRYIEKTNPFLKKCKLCLRLWGNLEILEGQRRSDFERTLPKPRFGIRAPPRL